MKIDYPRAGMTGPRRFLPSWRQLAAVVGLGVGLILVLFGVAYATVGIPDPNALAKANATILYYADGKTELGRLGAQNRVSVPLSKVPPQVQHAVLAAEDRNFRGEPGISPTGILRALWVDVRGGDVQQGGSTITQQYVKNAYLTQDRTLTRKLKEIVISLKLSRQQSKDQILEDYLNTIYFGRGAYGIQAASKAYFNKDVGQLNAAEGAVLAAVIRAPSYYDPSTHPDAAKARWHYVIDGMVKEGWLDAGKAAQLAFPKVAKQATGNRLGGPTGYLISEVQQELTARGFDEAKLGVGGYRVRTTFVKKAQDAAVAAVEQVVGKSAKDLRTALIAVKPGDGAVTAMYGGADYTERQFNNATDGRAQAGSSFKPYVLVAALQHGIGLKSRYDGSSPQTIRGQEIRNFGPGNGEQFGQIDLVTATAHSVNTVYFRLGFDAGGPTAVAKVAQDAGITGDVVKAADRAGGSIFLGGFGNGVHPIDAADAYATFAARGRQAKPYFVTSVTDASGGTVYRVETKVHKVFDTDVMADTTYALEHVVTEGTATNAQLDGGRPAAGKTGTTSGNTAAWFDGYTPSLSASVAMFRDGNKPLQGIAGLSEVTGGSLPAKVWKAFMDAALQGEPIQQFPPPAYVGTAKNPTPTATSTPSATPSSAAPTVTAAPKPTKTKPGKPVPTILPTATASPTSSPTGQATAGTGANAGSPGPGTSP